MKQENGSQKNNRIKRAVRAAVLTLIVAGAAGWWFLLREPDAPREIIEVSGRIESDDAAVAAKVSGRIREIRVR